MGELIHINTRGARRALRRQVNLQTGQMPGVCGEQWQKLITRGRALIESRFSCRVRYQTSVAWQSENTEVWTRLFFNRSAKQVIIDKDIYFPVYTKQHFFGAFSVSDAILLPETQLSQLFDLMSLIIDTGLKPIAENHTLMDLENALHLQSGERLAENIVAFRPPVAISSAPVSFTCTPPPPIVGHVVIECPDLEKSRRFAVDLMSSTVGNGMVSLNDFEPSFFTADELTRLTDMALFVSNLAELSPEQVTEIQKYLESEQNQHSLSLILASPVPLDELFEAGRCPVNLFYGRHIQKVRLRADEETQTALSKILDSFWRFDFMVKQEMS